MSKKAELTGNYFGTIYLTVISLLQSIALSQLVPIIIKYIETVENPLTDIHLLPLVLMLLIIFIVWHHYAIGIFFLRWFPNIIDTIIPFMISIGQFFLISYLNIDTTVEDIDIITWTAGFAVFFLIGSVAYFSAATRNDPVLFTNIMSLKNAQMHCSHSKKYYMVAGISILFQGLFALLTIFVGRDELLWVSLVFFLLHLVLSEYFLLKNIKPQFLRAIEEFDASKK